MQMKILTDFAIVISDLDAAIKKEKRKDYQEYLKVVKANIMMWRMKYDAFLTASGQKKEEKR